MNISSNWLEWQSTYGVRIQRRMSEILKERGQSDTYTLDELVAAEIVARREILGDKGDFGKGGV